MFQGGHTIGLPIIVLFVGVGRAVERVAPRRDADGERGTGWSVIVCGVGVCRLSVLCQSGPRPIHILNLEAERDIKPPQLRTKHHETS